ncbi:hypothetical protein PTTG_04635, partial [Puccinia triticina 1-1 BBBD Race 1]
MSDVYFLSESSGSRKSSLVESLFKPNEPSTFPLSPKLRHDQLIGLSHRRLGTRGSSFSRVHSYLRQLSSSEHEEKIALARGSPGQNLRRRLRQPRYRALLLLLIGFLAYQCLSRLIWAVTHSASPPTSNILPVLSPDDPHPLGNIIQDAQKSWEIIQKRQSKTYEAAVIEYRRRYKISPPSGFDKWFSFAKSHGHVLTDEYDSMMEQLASFRKMDRNDLHSRTNQVGKGEGRVYTRWATTNRPAHKELKRTQTWTFSKLIEKITRLDPTLFQDMSLAVNEHFEPRVVIPWETQENSDEDSNKSWNHNKFEGHDNAWTTFRKSCPPSSKAREQEDALDFPGYTNSSIEGRWGDRLQKPGLGKSTSATSAPMRFVTDSPAPIKDIYCNSPERRIEQGLFFSNTTKISGLFPVFSQSTAQGFGDIVIPSYLYIRDPYKTREYANEPVTKRSRGRSFIAGGQASHLDPSQWKEWDVTWEKKNNQIYWRGLLHDGGENPGGFQSNFGPTKKSIFGSKNSGLNSMLGIGTPNPKMITKEGLDRSFLNHKTMDVGYLAGDHCRIHEPCQELLKANYRLKMWEPFGAAKFFKWSLDLDGIGFSAKFLNLLQVGTAVVKQTVYREFYSDWV